MRNSGRSKFAAYPRLNPFGIGKDISAADLIDQAFLAYNGGRLREAAKLLTEKMLPKDGFIGTSLTGALTPAGLGKSCLIPLMKAGFIDWIVSTGANLYHDLHYGLDACAGFVAVIATGTVNTNAVSTNILTYAASDGDGNSNSITRTVIVRDTTGPVIVWSFTNLTLAAGTNCSALMPDVTGTNYILTSDSSGPVAISQ